MRAQLLHRFGDSRNLQLAEVPLPVPSANQVLIRIGAIGINGLETKIRNGWLEEYFPTRLPAILGKEFAGTVEQVGEGVTTLSFGDRVAGFSASGTYAEFTVASPEAIAVLPDALSFEQGATLPVAVETATRGITSLGIQRGWTVVVNGATGALGSAAVQLLVRQGVTVIGTCSSANHPYLASLGAVPVAYGAGLEARIRDLSPGIIDAVFDVAGHGFATTALALTGNAARVLTIADFEAASLGIQVSTGSREQVAAPFLPVLPLAASGEFQINIQQVFPLTELAAAHDLAESGHVRGKIILTA